MNSPKLQFDYEELYGFYDDEQYEYPYPSPKLLENLLKSFGDILEGQAEYLSRRLLPPSTPLSRYIDSLVRVCKAQLGKADPTLVANIASVVTNERKEKFTLGMVRNRIKKLSQRGFA